MRFEEEKIVWERELFTLKPTSSRRMTTWVRRLLACVQIVAAPQTTTTRRALERKEIRLPLRVQPANSERSVTYSLYNRLRVACLSAVQRSPFEYGRTLFQTPYCERIPLQCNYLCFCSWSYYTHYCRCYYWCCYCYCSHCHERVYLADIYFYLGFRKPAMWSSMPLFPPWIHDLVDRGQRGTLCSPISVSCHYSPLLR